MLGAAAAIATVSAVPAQASETIKNFEVVTSTTQAGDHPDLETKIELGNHGTLNPGEAAEDVGVHLPTGIFGNPNAVTKCTSDDFALEECPMDSQVGVIVIRANYGGDTENLLGTAPVYDMESRSADETARFAFIAPVANIPINIPIKVRTATDYGLTMTVTGISQVIPLASADIRIWGFPAARRTRRGTLPPGVARRTGGLSGRSQRLLRIEPGLELPPVDPAAPTADRQPDQLHRPAAGRLARRDDLPGRSSPSPRGIPVPADDRLLR